MKPDLFQDTAGDLRTRQSHSVLLPVTYVYIHAYIYTCTFIWIYIQIWYNLQNILMFPPDHMNYHKKMKVQLRWCVLWELVPDWYKKVLSDHIDQAEMNKSTMLSNQTRSKQSCTKNQILEHLILHTRFWCWYWTISQIIPWNLSLTIPWNLAIRQSTYIIDSVGWMGVFIIETLYVSL